MPNLNIFLLPHFDDEVGCLGLIRWSLLSQSDTLIVHLTRGDRKFGAFLNASEGAEEVRKSESKRLLKFLISGALTNPYWEDLGSDLNVGDSDLVFHLREVLMALWNHVQGHLLTSQEVDVRIFTPDFEGGHPDHDSSALIALHLREMLCSLGHAASCWAFPMYRRNPLSPLPALFKLTPVGGERTIIATPLDLRTRIAGLLCPYFFRSQIRTILSLYFGILRTYLFARCQVAWSLNEIPFQALNEGPGFLYEARGRFKPAEWRREAVENIGDERGFIT